jgi:hypothetical protein
MYKTIVVEVKSCEKCAALFPMYEDVKEDEKYCKKHRDMNNK